MSKLAKLKKGIDLGKPKGAARALSAPQPPARAASKNLANYGDPYVLADGTVVMPEKLFDDPIRDELAARSSRNYRPVRKRSKSELPANEGAMRGIALVFVFTIMGLSDRDIADSLGITSTQVRTIRTHEGYAETFEVISGEFVSAKSKHLVSRIAALADDALSTVHDIAKNGKKESNQLKASIDILDRAGVRPKDTAEMGKAQQNELRITIIKKDSDSDVVVDGVTID